MNDIEEIKENFIKREQFYLEMGKKERNPLEKIYFHEARSTLNGIKGLIEMAESGIIPPPKIEEMLGYAPPYLTKLLKLESLTREIPNFTKEGLKTQNPSDLRKILENEQKQIQLQYGIPVQIEGGNPQLYTKDSALTVFISTHMGDSTKWSPADKPINLFLEENLSKIKITIDNYKKQYPRKNIGLNQGVGTEYTQTYLSLLGGEIKTFDDQRFIKEITIPKN